MIYTSKQRAGQIADELNRTLLGHGEHAAARIGSGWTVRRGGTQTFREVCYGGPHTPLDVARGMVTLSPGHRTDL
jgi:hypothetical protein